MSTLSQDLSTWRSENQGGNGHTGLLSKLQIGQDLYDLKDPAVEYLATQIESRLSAVETKTWTAVTKDANASKFATAVTQDTNGAISVTYGTIRDSALEDTAVAHQFVTEVDQTVDGVVSISRSGIYDTDVELDSATKTLLDITGAKYVSDAIAALKTYAEGYTDSAVQNLAGQNWADNAKKVQEIIAELENSDNANAWATAIDKLAGLNINYTQAEADTHNAELTGAISTSTTLTAEQAAALNTILGSESYSADMAPSEADAKLYNATLEGAWSTSTVKTPQTVKQYVDAKFAEAQAAANGGISDLDATVSGNITTTNNVDAVSTGHNVGVKIVEEDGIITSVTVLENDIASAADLEALEDTVEEHSEVTAAALVDLDSRLTTLNTTVTGIDLTVKANKAAITTGTINNWSAQYDSNNENLVWTNTQTTVYVPVDGQSL